MDRKEYQRRYREAHKAEIREYKRKWAAANPNAAGRWQTTHPEKAREARRKWQKTPAAAEKRRAAARKRTYGIEDGRSSGTCDCCGEHTENIFLDHDHSTKRFRGWLCRGCNTAAGHLRDSPAKCRLLALYLEKTQEGKNP